jgi:hypothetical protein
MVRKPGTEDSHFTWTSDVDQVWLETFERFTDQGDVPEIGRIEAQILLEREREKTARQLERPHISLFDGGLGAIAGTHTEEGQVAAAGKRFKISAGMRHPVHFVERVGEVSNARWIGCHLSAVLAELAAVAEQAGSATVVAFFFRRD